MKIFTDLHIHSKYARGCSKDLVIENIVRNAKLKGLNLLGTGDFTHPLWLKELEENLKEAGDGVYTWRKDNSVFFILTTEVSTIFLRDGKIKRIHVLLGLPSFEKVKKLNSILGKFGELKSDGRSTLKLDLKDLIDIIFDVDEKALFIPAHIWTPWFSLYGSRSGFDSIKDAFGEKIKFVTAVETGLSSDPKMNGLLSELDGISIVSFSDAHSAYPHRLGREATALEISEINFDNILKAFKNPDEKNKILFTIEFFPEEGKYHYDGHRICGIRLSPQESKKFNHRCPVCLREITIGVMHRVIDLADRNENYIDQQRPPFYHLVPLTEILAQYYKKEPTNKKVLEIYQNMVSEFGNEFKILLGEIDQKIFERKYPEINEALKRIKEGKVKLIPGFDGEYGKVILFEKEEILEKARSQQKSLF
jgi:uncharacterized protein (TIGR00375 family)